MAFVWDIQNSRDAREALAQFNPSGHTCLIKPNFYTHREGYYTGARTLDLFLGAIPGRKIVIECYTVARTDGSRPIKPGQAKEHLDCLREQDRHFLSDTDIDEILDRHNAEFLNVTEEIWSGRDADAREVSRLVERRYPPIKNPDLYGCVPQKLLDLRGAPMLNLAKLKLANAGTDAVQFSLSMKNLFGLIPEPSRTSYHGKNLAKLPNSIADMYKIYTMLFIITHVAKAVYNTLISRKGFYDPNNPRKGPGLVCDLGLAATGLDPEELDAFIVSQFGKDPSECHFLATARGILGDWDAAQLPEVPAKFKSLFARYR